MRVKCICNVIGTNGDKLMRFENIHEGKIYEVEMDDGYQIRLSGVKGKFDKERFEEVDDEGLTAEDKSTEKKVSIPKTHKEVNKLQSVEDEGDCPF